jgi:hypothetical protein
VSEAATYAPCVDAPLKYRESCYYQLGQWVASSLRLDLAKAGEVCDGLSGAYRARCFMGAGESVTFGVRDDEALASCASFARGEDELSCRAGVSWAFFASGDRQAAAAACAYGEEAKTKRCLALSDLTGGLDPH